MSHIEHPAPFRPRMTANPVSSARKDLMRRLHGALVLAAFIFVGAGILGLFS